MTTKKPYKVLCLGMSYVDLDEHLHRMGKTRLDLSTPKPNDEDAEDDDESHSFSSSTVCHQVQHAVQAGWLAAMDGRDLIRCLATEHLASNNGVVDKLEQGPIHVYTVSQEKAAVYRSDRHVDANFNRPCSLVRALQQLSTPTNVTTTTARACRWKKKTTTATASTLFEPKPPLCPSLRFDEIVLDYFWIPAGWDAHRWNSTFFGSTLAELYSCLTPTTGRIYLPCRLHVWTQILAHFGTTLGQYYHVDAIRRADLKQITLWRGTQAVDAHKMQTIFGKRADQEEVYCGFARTDIHQAMDCAVIGKTTLLHCVERFLPDLDQVKFLVLLPVHQNENGQPVERGLFFGCSHPTRQRQRHTGVTTTTIQHKVPCNAAVTMRPIAKGRSTNKRSETVQLPVDDQSQQSMSQKSILLSRIVTPTLRLTTRDIVPDSGNTQSGGGIVVHTSAQPKGTSQRLVPRRLDLDVMTTQQHHDNTTTEGDAAILSRRWTRSLSRACQQRPTTTPSTLHESGMSFIDGPSTRTRRKTQTLRSNEDSTRALTSPRRATTDETALMVSPTTTRGHSRGKRCHPSIDDNEDDDDSNDNNHNKEASRDDSFTFPRRSRRRLRLFAVQAAKIM